jgi:hypothetical protein
MIDTAGTLVNAANALVRGGRQGACRACATHAVLSGPAVAHHRVAPHGGDRDQLHPAPGEAQGTGKFKVVSIARLLAEAIRRITPLGLGELSVRLTRGFFAVKPRGFICAGRHSTLDGRDPRVRAAAEVLPKPDAPVPFKVGVMAVSAPQYQRVPTRAEQEKHEPGLVDHLAKVAAASVPIPKGVTGTFDTKKAGRGPSTAFTTYVDFAKPSLVSKEEAYEGRKMAFAAELDAEGRTFLVTPDLTLVPKDKVVFVDMPKLQGVELAKSQLKLPFGYAWIEDVPKLRQRDNGEMVETGDVYGRQAFVQIEGPLVRGKKGGNFWKTADGTYVRHELLSIFKPRTDRPPGVGKSDKWIDVRVTWGSLIAYEGDKPVYATAISPGVDGITQRARGHTTVLGTYTVGWKLVSADMSGVEKKKEWAVDDVPFVNYFKDSYAVHGAWWHNDFGRPKSHGCVNVAPNDAHWLWHWMEPGLPEGWYAVAAFRPEVKGTTIVIRP